MKATIQNSRRENKRELLHCSFNIDRDVQICIAAWQEFRGEPSKMPRVDKMPHARFSEVLGRVHFLSIPGKQKPFKKNTDLYTYIDIDLYRSIYGLDTDEVW